MPNATDSVRTMLLVVGQGLEPDEVTRLLAMFPDHAYRTGDSPPIEAMFGEPLHRTGVAEWSAWKKHIPPELSTEPLEHQLGYWCDQLATKRQRLEDMQTRGWSFAVKCFLDVSDSMEIDLPFEITRKVASVGMALVFNIHCGSDVSHGSKG